MKRLLMALTIAVLGLAYSGTAQAFTQTAAGSMNIGLTVTPACTVATTPMVFGPVTDLPIIIITGPTSTITVHCSNNTSYRIDIGKGLHSDLSASMRYMADGTGILDSAHQISYSLYKNTTDTVEWGDNGATFCPTCGPAATGKSGIGTGADEIHTVYGVMTTNGTLLAGSYSDTVSVTVNY